MLTPSSTATVSPTTLSALTSGQAWPQSATLSNGGVVVAWISSGNQILVNIYNAFGTFVANGASISAASGATFATLSVAGFTTGGGYVIAYEQVGTLNTKIYFNTYTSSGAAAVVQTQVVSLSVGSGAVGTMSPRVTALSTGNFAIAYLVPQNIVIAPTAAKGIYMGIYSGSTGSTVSAPIVASNNNLNSNTHFPTIATLYDGGFVMVYHNTVSTYSQIYIKIFGNSGSTTTAYVADQTTTTDNFYPCVSAFKGASGFVVGWQSGSSGFTSIYSSTYTSSGVATATNTVVSFDFSATIPSVVTTTNGLIIFAWVHNPGSGSSSGVYLTSNDASSNSTYFEANQASSSYPNTVNTIALTAVGNGFFAVWAGATTSSSSSYGIYGLGYDNIGDKTGFTGSCFASSDCSSSSLSCLYNSRTCAVCAADTDCPSNYGCYKSMCQTNVYIATQIFGSLLGTAVSLVWWIILLIVLGGVLCLVILGCIIWRLCRRPSTRTIVVKQGPVPTTFVATAQPQGFNPQPQGYNTQAYPRNY